MNFDPNMYFFSDLKTRYELAEYRYLLREQVDKLNSLEDQWVAERIKLTKPPRASHMIRCQVARVRAFAEKLLFEEQDREVKEGHTTVEFIGEKSRSRVGKMCMQAHVSYHAGRHSQLYGRLERKQQRVDEIQLSFTMRMRDVILTFEQTWVMKIMKEIELQHSYKILGDRRYENRWGYYIQSYLSLEREIELGEATLDMRENYERIRTTVRKMFCLYDYCKLKPEIEKVFGPTIFNEPLINVERSNWGTEGLLDMARYIARNNLITNTRDTGTQSPEIPIITID